MHDRFYLNWKTRPALYFFHVLDWTRAPKNRSLDPWVTSETLKHYPNPWGKCKIEPEPKNVCARSCTLVTLLYRWYFAYLDASPSNGSWIKCEWDSTLNHLQEPWNPWMRNYPIFSWFCVKNEHYFAWLRVIFSSDKQMVEAKVKTCLRHIGSFHMQAWKKNKDQ